MICRLNIKLIETICQFHFYRGAKIMDAIGNFFGEIFYRLSAQLRFKASDAIQTKLNETMNKPFNRNTSANQQKESDSQD
jgi:hypothetical protein